MTSLSIDTLYKGYDVEATFNSGLTLLTGNSGDGKSFLLKASRFFCKNNGIKSLFVDDVLISDLIASKITKNVDEAQVIDDVAKDYIISNMGNADVILLDNADLYLNDLALIKKLRESKKVVVISMKKPASLGFITRCIVRMDSEKLRLE